MAISDSRALRSRVEEAWRLSYSGDRLERLVGSGDAAVLRFLENRHTAQVRVRVEEAIARGRQLPSRRRGKEARRRTNHGVSHPADVDPAGAVADVRMRAGQMLHDPGAPRPPTPRQGP